MLFLMTVALTMTILVATRTWNPWPQARTEIVQWWENFTALSDPDPKWSVRIGGAPDIAAVMTTGHVVVHTRGFLTGHDPADGRVTWDEEVQWALPAYDVVVARLRPANPDAVAAPTSGFVVLDPSDGGVLWADDAAQAVWAFADAIVDLTCDDGGGCRLRARNHQTDSERWSLTVPGEVRPIRGPNPALAGTRDPAEWFAEAAAGTPDPVPDLFGLEVDGRVYIVDTFRPEYIREVVPPNGQTRVAVANDRYLYVQARPGPAGCVYRVEAFNYQTAAPEWSRDGYSLDTASGAGCEQRRQPLGRDGQLVVNTSDGHPRLVLAQQRDDSVPKWVGESGEHILAVDSELAVILGADRQTLRLVDLQRAERPTIWTYKTGFDPEAALIGERLIIRDADKATLLVVSRTGTVTHLRVSTKSSIIGYGPTGLILASGRKVGLHPFGPVT